MDLESSEIESGICSVSLSGKMDILGTQEIDMKFTALTASKKAAVLVDLSKVTLLASIGIRTLVTSAKAQKLRGGTMVLYRPTELIEQVLKSTGIDEIIPIAHDMDAARTALGVA